MIRSLRLASLAGLALLAAGPAFAQSDVTFLRLFSGGNPPRDYTYAQTQNPNAIVGGAGNAVSFCPALSCISGNGFTDHQRTSFLISAVTGDGAHSEEQTLAVTTTVNKGELVQYRPNTAYSVGQEISPVPGNAAYKVIQAGTTGPNSQPPTSRPATEGQTFQDGSVIWQWINDGAIVAKIGIYNEVKNAPGGGASWAQANNFELDPGHHPSFNLNTEFDFTNNSGTNCEFGLNCINLYVAMGGNNTSSAGINILSNNTGNYASIWGLRLNGDKLAREAAIAIDANSKYGIAANQFGLGGSSFVESFVYDNSASLRGIEIVGAKGFGAFVDGSNGSGASFLAGGTKTNAVYQDFANAPKGFLITGTKTVATYEDSSTSPAAFSVSGSKSFASYFDNSSTPIAIRLTGTYSSAQIAGNGFTVFPDGGTTAHGYATQGQWGVDCNSADRVTVRGGIVVACN